jgi:molecular chaperone DnaJ
METRDFYAMLGVQPEAGAGELRDAFRRLATRYHRDLAGPQPGRPFQQVVGAYRVLSDPRQRASYDAGFLPAPVAPAHEPEMLVPGPISLEHDFQAREPSVEEVLERILRNYTGRHVPKSEGLGALDLELGVPAHAAASGGTILFGVPVFYPCPRCHGEGHDGFAPCLACDRTGLLEEEEPARLHIPPLSRNGDLFDLPLHGLGIHNLYLRVRLRVG